MLPTGSLDVDERAHGTCAGAACRDDQPILAGAQPQKDHLPSHGGIRPPPAAPLHRQAALALARRIVPDPHLGVSVRTSRGTGNRLTGPPQRARADILCREGYLTRACQPLDAPDGHPWPAAAGQDHPSHTLGRGHGRCDRFNAGALRSRAIGHIRPDAAVGSAPLSPLVCLLAAAARSGPLLPTPVLAACKRTSAWLVVPSVGGRPRAPLVPHGTKGEGRLGRGPAVDCGRLWNLCVSPLAAGLLWER